MADFTYVVKTKISRVPHIRRCWFNCHETLCSPTQENAKVDHQLRRPTPHAWGKDVIDEFFSCGGFHNPKSISKANERFLHLIDTTYTKDSDWHERLNALTLATWICIENDADRADATPLLAAILDASNGFINEEHPSWLGQMAFELFHFWYEDNDASAWICGDRLRGVIRRALTKNYSNENFRFHLLNFEMYLGSETAKLFGGAVHFSDFHRTRKLLIKLGALGENEAEYLLALLRFGGDAEVNAWLKHASSGLWPTRQVAAFHAGIKCNCERQGSGDPYLNRVVCPFSQDDPTLELLLAAEARYLLRESARSPKLINPLLNNWWSADGSVVWDQHHIVNHVRSDLIALCEVLSASKKSIPNDDLKIKVTSLAVETGQLIEVFLKWLLIGWPGDQKDLYDEFLGASRKEWEFNHIAKLIGNIFGGSDGLSKKGLIALFQLAGIAEVTSKSRELEELLVLGPHRWQSKASFPKLIIANALAAKFNVKHPFRCLPIKLVERTVSGAQRGFSVRNDYAHYVPGDASELLGRVNSALVFSATVRSLIEEFMKELERTSTSCT